MIYLAYLTYIFTFILEKNCHVGIKEYRPHFYVYLPN